MIPFGGPLFWLKAGGIAALVAVLAFAGIRITGWHRDSLALGAVRQEMAQLKAAQEASHKASEGLQHELQELRSARKPAPSVRLCKQPQSVPEGGTGRDGSTLDGDLPPEVGENIGPDLYGLADEADELAARLRACQSLVRP